MMGKLLTNKWLGLVISIILSFLAIYQEHTLDASTSILLSGSLGVLISIIVGALFNAFGYVMSVAFDYKKVFYWFIGGLIGVILALIIL